LGKNSENRRGDFFDSHCRFPGLQTQHAILATQYTGLDKLKS